MFVFSINRFCFVVVVVVAFYCCNYVQCFCFSFDDFVCLITSFLNIFYYFLFSNYDFLFLSFFPKLQKELN